MAQFDITPEAQLPASYVQYSQGIRSDRDTALGDLFSNLAGVVERGVQEEDRAIQQKIQEDIFDQVESVQDEFGVGSATDMQNDYDASTPTPAGVTRAMEHIQGLEAAHQRGALKESHYWARLNSMVRQLRAKYPGYRAQIDQMVASVTGSRPANALRSSLMSEWAAEGGQSDLDKLEDWAVKNGRLPTDYYERQAQNQEYSLAELRAYISRKQFQEAERKDRRDAMSEESEKGTLTTNRAERSLRTELNQFAVTALSDINSSIGRDYREIQDRIAEAQNAMASGQPMDARALESIRGAIGRLRQQFSEGAHALTLESWDENPDHSYASVLDPATVDAAIEQAMQPIAFLERSLSADNPYGALGALSAWLKAQDDEAARDFLKNVPHTQTLWMLADKFGAEVASLYLKLNPDVQNAFSKAVADYHKGRMALGDGSMEEALQDGQRADLPKEYFDDLITSWTSLVEDMATMPPELIRNNISAIFGEDSGRVMSQLEPESRFEYFRQIANPIVSHKMMALRDQGDIESWRTYQRWVSQAFQSLFHQSVSDVQSYVADENFNVSWDPDNRRFDIEAVEGSMAGSPIFGLGQEWLPFAKNIEQLNTALQTIAPIFDDADADTERELLQMLDQMGFDPDQAGSGTMPQALMRALIEFLQSGWSVGADAQRVLDERNPGRVARRERGPRSMEELYPRMAPGAR